MLEAASAAEKYLFYRVPSSYTDLWEPAVFYLTYAPAFYYGTKEIYKVTHLSAPAAIDKRPALAHSGLNPCFYNFAFCCLLLPGGSR